MTPTVKLKLKQVVTTEVIREQWTSFTNPSMHLFHILQCPIQNRNVHISDLNRGLWDTEQVHSGICETFVGRMNMNPLRTNDINTTN